MMQKISDKRRVSLGKAPIVRDRLRDMARSMGPNAKLPTRDELCMELGTSRATIDGILQGLEEENIIFRRRGSGIYVSPKVNRKYIRVLINASLIERQGISPFWGILWGKLVNEGQKRAAYKNEEVHVQLVAPDPNVMRPLPPDVMRGLESGQIHGVLCIGMTEPFDDWSISGDIPMVAFAGPGHWQVVIRPDLAIEGAVSRLKEHGCRTIGYWRGSEFEFSSGGFFMQAKRDAELFLAALANAGLPYHAELHRIGAVSASELERDRTGAIHRENPTGYQAQGYKAAMRTFAASNTLVPDGLVIDDDMITSGALVAMQELGIQPGKDVIIASHSNAGSPLLFGMDRRLILWQTHPGEVITAMYGLLDRLIAGETPENRQVYAWERLADQE